MKNAIQKNYEAVRRKLRFHRLPMQEKNRFGEFVMLTSEKKDKDRFFELTVMSKNGDSQVSRIYKSGKHESSFGSWMRVSGNDEKTIRILNKLCNGELIQMNVTGNRVVTHRFGNAH